VDGWSIGESPQLLRAEGLCDSSEWPIQIGRTECSVSLVLLDGPVPCLTLQHGGYVQMVGADGREYRCCDDDADEGSDEVAQD
jgi:hypothetical protein